MPAASPSHSTPPGPNPCTVQTRWPPRRVTSPSLSAVIRGKGLFLPLYRQNVVSAVLEIITGQIPEVVGINLSKNKLTSLMPFKSIKSSLKELKALDLSHNSVRA